MIFHKINIASSSQVSGGVRFDDSSLRAIRAAHRRKWTVFATIMVVAATGVAVAVHSHVTKEKEDTLANEYIAIDSLYDSEQRKFQEDFAAYQKNIQQIMQTQKSTTLPDIPAPKPNHAESAKKFAEYAKANIAHPLGWQAALKSSSSFIEQGNLDEAKALLEGLESHTLNKNIIQLKVRRSLAGIYADKGEFNKALSELDVLEKLPDNPMVPEARLFRAKVQYLAGNKTEAAKILRELASNPEPALLESGNSVATEASIWLSYWNL